jgi:transcriptional regulator GlxA family with amidase domain
MADAGPIEIGILIYPGAQMAAVLGLTDLFGMADRLARTKLQSREVPLLRVSHWEVESPGNPPHRVFNTWPGEDREPAVLLLPPALGDPIPAETVAVFSAWLHERHKAGGTLGSVCAGAFLLGETGLLAGRTITTHWAYGEAFRTRFPEVGVDTDRLIIDDGDIITVGGMMAWTDLGLKLVDRFLGPTIMIETARQMLVDPPGREQRTYSVFSPRLTHGDAAILKVQHWLQANTAEDKRGLLGRSGRAGGADLLAALPEGHGPDHDRVCSAAAHRQGAGAPAIRDAPRRQHREAGGLRRRKRVSQGVHSHRRAQPG